MLSTAVIAEFWRRLTNLPVIMLFCHVGCDVFQNLTAVKGRELEFIPTADLRCRGRFGSFVNAETVCRSRACQIATFWRYKQPCRTLEE